MHRTIPRTTTLAIAVAALASAAVGGTRAHAEANRARGAFSSTTAQPTELGTPRFPDAGTGEVLVPFVGYDRIVGVIDGTQSNAGALSINFATFTGSAVSLAHFTGSVRGCPGPGTATIRYDVVLGAEPGKNIGTFTIVEGSGTGGLAGLSGGGSLVATPMRDGTVPSEGTARVRCADGDR